MKIVKTIKYRMYPSVTQINKLELWCKLCRRIYNAAIEHRQHLFNFHKAYTSWQSQSKEITQLRALDQNYANVPSDILAYVTRQVDQAYDKFYENIKQYNKNKGKFRKPPKSPRFKSYKDPISLVYMRSNGFRVQNLNGKYARIFGFPKIKEGIRIKYHKQIDGNVRSQIIVKDNDKWYLCVVIEKEMEIINSNSKSVGIDLGVKRNIQLSDGNYKNLPLECMNKLLLRKKKLQRRLSKKKAGDRRIGEKQSKNYQKLSAKIAKIDQKIAGIRKYHNNMFAAEIARDYGFIAIENLKLQNMTRSAKGTIENPGKKVKQKSGLNKAILNVAPGMFKTTLINKIKETGSILVEVNPAYTSQTCFECGHIDSNNRPNQETFECVQCGHKNNADHNAAKNILKLAEKELTFNKTEDNIKEEIKNTALNSGNLSLRRKSKSGDCEIS